MLCGPSIYHSFQDDGFFPFLQGKCVAMMVMGGGTSSSVSLHILSMLLPLPKHCCPLPVELIGFFCFVSFL